MAGSEMAQFCIFLLSLAVVALWEAMLYRRRRRRKQRRDEMRHLLGAERWWGRR